MLRFSRFSKQMNHIDLATYRSDLDILGSPFNEILPPMELPAILPSNRFLYKMEDCI